MDPDRVGQSRSPELFAGVAGRTSEEKDAPTEGFGGMAEAWQGSDAFPCRASKSRPAHRAQVERSDLVNRLLIQRATDDDHRTASERGRVQYALGRRGAACVRPHPGHDARVQDYQLVPVLALPVPTKDKHLGVGADCGVSNVGHRLTARRGGSGPGHVSRVYDV